MNRRGERIADAILESTFGFVGSILLVVALIVGGVALAARYGTHHYAEATCNSFGKQANREVRFVDYTFWQWDCLTPTADGKWISRANLREFGELP